MFFNEIEQDKKLSELLDIYSADEITYPVVPAVAYTIPRIATVGVPAFVADATPDTVAVTTAVLVSNATVCSCPS